jgi:NADPH:quinone reductase-like Zn-dependent oxidoreductase
MKAIQVHQFGGPEVLQVCDVEVPQLRNEEVLVRVKAAGVNPYDTYMRSGGYGAKNPALPYTPGSDAAEIFAAIDAGLRNGTLQPVSGTELPLVDAAEAHRRVMAPGASGKIVLTP